jgi:hypothetical protein
MTVTLTVSVSIRPSYSTGAVVLRRLTNSQHVQLSQCSHQFCSAFVSPRLEVDTDRDTDKNRNTGRVCRDDLSTVGEYCCRSSAVVSHLVAFSCIVRYCAEPLSIALRYSLLLTVAKYATEETDVMLLRYQSL